MALELSIYNYTDRGYCLLTFHNPYNVLTVYKMLAFNCIFTYKF